jgi:peptidoglycan/LPS O-acetylase OafA/YrhL
MEPDRRLGYVPALDGARGVAILLVVLMHAYNNPTGGFLGVEIFFVLSGFLITTLLLQEQRRTGRIGLRAFYRRRALRLVPALAVVVGAYAAASIAVACGARPFDPRDAPASSFDILAGVLYLSDVVQAWGGLLPPGIRHLWSLATEEQFYLLWPFVLVALLRRRASARTQAAVLVAGIAAAAGTRLGLTVAGAGWQHLYFSPETTFDALLVGCLCAVWLVHGTGPRVVRSERFRRCAWPLAVAVIAAAVYLVPSTEERLLFSVVMLPFDVAAALLIVVAALDGRTLLARVLRLPPLTGLGRISYGLYLWHPVVLWSTGYVRSPTLGVALSLVLALASYRFVERPFLRRKARLAARQWEQPEPQPPTESAGASPSATWNDEPHPHDETAFGLSILKPDSWIVSR